MKPETREKILAYNKAMAKNREAASDLYTLLEALPPGQVKQLLRDDDCGRILRKYGLGGD